MPLLLAGVGSGLVISPNTTLTLSKVPVSLGGSASGVLQTGQRIGSAAGIAMVGAVFFAHVANHADWGRALQLGLLTALAFVLLALAVAVADVRGERREAPPSCRARPESPKGGGTPPPTGPPRGRR